MNHISIQNKQSQAQPDVLHALLLATPLWASGLAFLAAVFSAIKIEDPHGYKFLTLAALMVVVATMAVFRVMGRLSERTHENSLASRRRKLRVLHLRAGRSGKGAESAAKV